MSLKSITCDFLVGSVATKSPSAVRMNWKGIVKPITIQQKVTILLQGHQPGRRGLELQVHDLVVDRGLGLQNVEESVTEHPQGTYHFVQAHGVEKRENYTHVKEIS